MIYPHFHQFTIWLKTHVYLSNKTSLIIIVDGKTFFFFKSYSYPPINRKHMIDPLTCQCKQTFPHIIICLYNEHYRLNLDIIISYTFIRSFFFNLDIHIDFQHGWSFGKSLQRSKKFCQLDDSLRRKRISRRSFIGKTRV